MACHSRAHVSRRDVSPCIRKRALERSGCRAALQHPLAHLDSSARVLVARALDKAAQPAVQDAVDVMDAGYEPASAETSDASTVRASIGVALCAA